MGVIYHLSITYLSLMNYMTITVGVDKTKPIRG